MRKHPEIFSDAALRHIKTGGTKPPGEMTASELPPMAVSWSSTEHLPVGEWKEKAPKYVRGLSPCLTHCPVGNDVEGFVSKVRDNDIETAVKLLLAENPLPATCGRVCYHPCEDGCNRKELDGAVGIRAIERYLGDHPEFKGSDIWQQAKPSSGKKIAVIGSGPSGLACAWGLALLGHKVEVYEQKEKAGGLLRYGIPAYRLPKDVLDREIGRITDVGVKFFYSWKIGEDRIIKDMLAAFDAVFVAAGAVKTRQLGIQGENNNNVWSALDFLNTVANGIIPDIGARCVIIGGGNSAVDAARSARRLGAESTILYRRTCNEMPAHQAEIDDAIAEGVIISELAVPLEFILEDGTLRGVNCLRTRLGEPDSSGRRKPLPVPGSDFAIECESVINALGEMVSSEDLTSNLQLIRAMKTADAWGKSMHPSLFAGGDFTGGERTVAHAIGGGKRAAMAIDRFLLGTKNESLERYRVGGGPASLASYLRSGDSEVTAGGIRTIQFDDLNPAYFPARERAYLEKHLLESRDFEFSEVEPGMNQAQAIEEAERCFSCGRCTKCGLCQIFCPEGAVRKNNKNDLMIFDSHCKGCGICVEECPRCAIEFREES